MVLPSRIELLVTPTSVAVGAPLEPPEAAMVARKAASTQSRGPILAIEAPPVFRWMYLNSLGVGGHLSSLPFAGPSEPCPQASVAGVDQADDPVGGEDHDQDQ